MSYFWYAYPYMDPNHQPPLQPRGGLPVQPGAQADPQNPYGFIMDTQRMPKQSMLKPGSLRGKLLIVVLAGLIITLLIVGASSLLKRGSKATIDALVSLVAEQQEIIRVSDIGIKTTTDSNVTTLAETTKVSIISQQKTLSTYLTDRGVILTAAMTGAKFDKTTDATLTSAYQNSQFTDTFTAALKANLTTYATDLKKRYDATNTTNLKALLANDYRGTIVLLK
jgi:hypothetical protein